MGDCGYLDQQGRFWFCGRVAHRVVTAQGPMYPIRCEAIFNQHPAIRRSALVGIGPPGPAASGNHPGAAPGADAGEPSGPRSLLAEIRRTRGRQPADGQHLRLPAASQFSGRHSSQREDFPRETGRLGGEAKRVSQCIIILGRDLGRWSW